MRHSGCVGGWFIFLRSVQLILAFGTLGLASYFITLDTADPDLTYNVALAAITICWVLIGFVLYCINKLLPLVVIVADAGMLVAWVACTARYLKLREGLIVLDCGIYKDPYFYYYDVGLFIRCHLWKALFGLMLIEMVTFIPTIVLASVIFHRARKAANAPEAGLGYPSLDGKPGLPSNNTQAPPFLLVNPVGPQGPQGPQVYVPYHYLQQQQPLEDPQPLYHDPIGTRYTSPPPQQQYYMDPRYQSPPPEEDRPPSAFSDQQQVLPPVSVYQYTPRAQ